MSEHKNLTDPQIHEPKGVSNASAGARYIADGSGSGSWELPPTIKENLTKVSEINSVSSLSQNPTGLDTPLQVNFGSGATSTNVDVSATGTVTYKTAGFYETILSGTFARATDSPFDSSGSVMLVRVLLNDVQLGTTLAFTMEDSDSLHPLDFKIMESLEAGTTLKVEIMRDSSGVDSGGLFPVSPVQGDWTQIPSAEIRIKKFEVI